MREKSRQLAASGIADTPRARPQRSPALLYHASAFHTFAFCLLPFAFCLLPFAFCLCFSSSSAAAEQPLKLDVLRAGSNGTILDVLLKVEVAEETGDLGPRDFAVFIAPADLAVAEATKPQFRLPRLFLKRLGRAYYIDLRQLPAGVGAAACQLVLRIERGGRLIATHRLAQLLDAPAEELDVALLIDESLSMRRTDREELRIAAAKTFVDLARRSTRISRIAVIGFNHKARTLAPLTSPLQADDLYKAIDRIGAIGQTDMDSALTEARKVFAQSPAAAKALVLLTDGRDEPGRYENAHRHFANQRWPIYTVGLSERADTRVLQRVARDTGGEYHEAPTNAELQDIFGRICLTLQKKVLIRSRRHALPAGKHVADPLAIDDSISALTVSLKARDPDIRFGLRNPAGRVLTPELKAAAGISYDRRAAFQHYDVWTPPPGTWAAQLAAPRPAEATVAATAVTPLLLRAFPLRESYYRGEPIELAASLAIADSVLSDAHIEARVTTADGSTTTVQLHDDGQHQDTGAHDGVFAGWFPGSEAPGPSAIRLVATGTTPAGHRFERELDLATAVSAEGYSKLWCAARAIDFGLLYSGERATRAIDLKLTSALEASLSETVRTQLQPLALADGRAFPHDALRLSPSPLRLEAGQLAALSLALAVPPGQPAGSYRGVLTLASKYDRAVLPIQAEVRHPRLVVEPKAINLGAIESGSRAEARFSLRLEPKGAATARLASSDGRIALSSSQAKLTTTPTQVTIALAAPAGLATTLIDARLTIDTPCGKAELPVTARIVQPSFALAPAAIDFGELKPGDSSERKLSLRVEGIKPQQAAIAAPPLPGPQGAPSLRLAAPATVALKPGADAAAPLKLTVPPAQPPGVYRGVATVSTPLGERKVTVTARIAGIDTFRVPPTLEFGRVAIGETKELALTVESLVDAGQKVAIAVPPPGDGWQLTADPATATVPPRGKAEIILRLAAGPGTKPGPIQATVGLRGPSRGAELTARAEVFRTPHQSIALPQRIIDVGRLQAGVVERVAVPIRSIVAEPQKVAVERIEAPADIVGLEASPREWTLPPSGTQVLTLTLHPASGPDEAPFEASVTLRGRSLPATLAVRGSVFTPPGETFVLEPAVLDFGAVERGESPALPLTVASTWHRGQKVSFAAEPSSQGVRAEAAQGGGHVPPGVAWRVPIRLSVASDAPLGERLLTWEVRGPGEPETLEVRVEVVPKATPAAVARAAPGGIGWVEAAAIFLLLLLLVAALIAAWYLARWLIRNQRVPRMAKYFAMSALVHAIVLFTALDLFIAHKVRKEKLGPTFKVGLKAVAGSLFSSQEPSAADGLRDRAERERRIEAARRSSEAQRLAREILEAQRRQLAPSQAQLDRPKPKARPELAEAPTQTRKHSAEHLAELIEQIREAERVRQTRQTTPETPAETRAERVARVRAMSRAELEEAARIILQPKAAKPDRPTVEPDMPQVARAATAEKAAPKLDDLLPAIEDLRQELVGGAGGGEEEAALAARQVGTTRIGRQASIEHATTTARRAAAHARSTIESAGGGPQRPTPSRLLEPSPAIASAAKKPGLPGLDIPEEALAPSPGAEPRAVAQEPGGTGIGSRDVGAAPVARHAAVARPAGGGTRGASVAARDIGESTQHAAPRPGIPAGLAAPEAAPAARRAQPTGFGAPDETPTVDAAIRLPGSPGAAAVEAKPIAVARRAGGAPVPADVERPGGGEAGRAARAPIGARTAAVERPGTAAALPSPTAGRPAAPKAAPALSDFVLEEGPLLAPRQQAAAGSSGEPAERTVVARWRLRRRGEPERGFVAAVTAGADAGPATPRGATIDRPTATAPALGLGVAIGASQERREGPALDHLPEATVEARPGIATARDTGIAATAVAPTRATTVGRGVERETAGIGAGAADRPPIGPRQAASVARGTGTEPLPAGGEAASARREAPALPSGLPEEAVEPGPRIASASGGAGPAERDVAPPSVTRGGREIARAPAAAPPLDLSPRAPTPDRTSGRSATRLLLPGISAHPAGAGAVAGTDADGVTRIVLTTIRYGSGEVDWDTHKTTMPFFAWQLRERIGFNIDTRIAEVPLESPKVMKSPWIYMSGHKDFRFTADQIDNLRRYLLGGGTLWADDSTHETDFTWDKAFRREIARVLSPRDGYRLRKITKDEDHPLFRSCFDLSKGYAGYWPPPGDKYRQNFIEGIEIGGRLAVIYTRNDYGDGLEIKPDTFPLKASLSGLSPAEMQDASFLMASNIVVYILTRGRGAGDQGLLARAADSLRHHHEARRTRRDPYDEAPATLFDDFRQPNWEVADDWDQAGSARLTYGRSENADEPGRRLEVRYALDGDDAKVVLLRDLPEELDVSGQDRCYVDIESQLDGGARLSLALITLPGWNYFESRPAFLKPGRNRVHFDLKGATWKTGEAVPEGKSEYCRRIGNPDSVRRFVLLLYPVGRRGTVVVDRIEFRARP